MTRPPWTGARGPSAPRPPVTPEQAVAEVREGGYEPEEPYPGGATRMWRVYCVECGAPRVVRLTQVRHGRKRCAHSAPRALADETPQERERRERERRREMVRAGYRPLEAPPRLVGQVMDVVCVLCGMPRRVALADVRSGRRCAHTNRGPNRINRDTN